jgi:hypothetical protein
VFPVLRTCFITFITTWRIPSSWILRRVALVGTDVSEERRASIIRVTRIGDLRTLTVTSNRRVRESVLNSKYSDKTFPSAALSTINPTRRDPDSNPGRRGWKPVTNSYCKTFKYTFSVVSNKSVSLLSTSSVGCCRCSLATHYSTGCMLGVRLNPLGTSASIWLIGTSPRW